MNIFTLISNLPSDIQEYIYSFDSTYKKEYSKIIEEIIPIKIRALKVYLQDIYNINIRDCDYFIQDTFYYVTLPNNYTLQLCILTEENTNNNLQNIIINSIDLLDYYFVIKYLDIYISENFYDILQESCYTTEMKRFLYNHISNIDIFVNDAITRYGRKYFLSLYGNETIINGIYIYSLDN